MIEVVRRREDREGERGDERDPSERQVFVIEESLGYLANVLARSFARELGVALAPHGVTVAQWAVLMFLWAEDGPTQTELSRLVAIEDATMVRTIDRMERDGLVQRVRNRRDRRRINIHLTERGRALRDRLVPCAVEVNQAATRSLSEADRLQFAHLLREVIASLDEPEAGKEGT